MPLDSCIRRNDGKGVTNKGRAVTSLLCKFIFKIYTQSRCCGPLIMRVQAPLIDRFQLADNEFVKCA